MRYEGNIIRPPSETESLILQVSYGCSHNRCTFCPTYKGAPFRPRPLDDIAGDIRNAETSPKRVFLCDGDAVVLPMKKLVSLLDMLNENFPDLRRIGVYGSAKALRTKSGRDLQILAEKKLGIIYLGLESGSDRVLKKVCKGAEPAEMIEAAGKIKEAGIKLSVMALLGLGGTELSGEHGIETGGVLSAMSPDYISLLTVMLVPGTPLFEREAAGKFHLPGPMDILKEMKLILENLDVERSLFFSNHASNYLPLKGRLPGDREKMIDAIDRIRASGDDSLLRPESARGL